MEGAPEVIYLQTGGHDPEVTFSDLDPESVTWCEDEILDGDTKYVRADIVDRLRAENERLRKRADELQAELHAKNDLWRRETERAERAEAALRGGVVVPEEPTEEMIQAWHDRAIEGADYIDRHSIEYALYVACYKAMLAASKIGSKK